MDAIMTTSGGISLLAFDITHAKVLMSAAVLLFGILPTLVLGLIIYSVVISFFQTTVTDRNFLKWMFQNSITLICLSAAIGGFGKFVHEKESGMTLNGVYFYNTDKVVHADVAGRAMTVDVYGAQPFESFASMDGDEPLAYADSGNLCAAAAGVSTFDGGSGSKTTLFMSTGGGSDKVFNTLYRALNSRLPKVPGAARVLFYLNNSLSSVMYTAAHISATGLIKSSLTVDALKKWKSALFSENTPLDKKLETFFAYTDEYFREDGETNSTLAANSDLFSMSKLAPDGVARVEIGKVHSLADVAISDIKRAQFNSQMTLASSLINEQVLNGDEVAQPLMTTYKGLSGGEYNVDVLSDAMMKHMLVSRACTVNPDSSSRGYLTGNMLQANSATAVTGNISTGAYDELLSTIFASAGSELQTLTRDLAEFNVSMPDLSVAQSAFSNLKAPNISDLITSFSGQVSESMAPCMTYGKRVYENMDLMYDNMLQNIDTIDAQYEAENAAFAMSDASDSYAITLETGFDSDSDMDSLALNNISGNQASLGSALRKLLQPLGDEQMQNLKLSSNTATTNALMKDIQSKKLPEIKTPAGTGAAESHWYDGITETVSNAYNGAKDWAAKEIAEHANVALVVGAVSTIATTILTGGTALVLQILFALFASVPFIIIMLAYVTTFYRGIFASGAGILCYPIWFVIKAAKSMFSKGEDSYGGFAFISIVEFVAYPAIIALELCAVAVAYGMTLEFFNNFAANTIMMMMSSMSALKVAGAGSLFTGGSATLPLDLMVDALKPLGVILTVSAIPMAFAAIIRGEAAPAPAKAIAFESMKEAQIQDLSNVAKNLGYSVSRRLSTKIDTKVAPIRSNFFKAALSRLSGKSEK